MIDLCWLKFIRAFGLMMQLAEESRLIMMLISCTMAVAFIVNALHRCAQLENNLEYLTLSYLFELSCVKNEHLMEVTDQLKWISQPGSSMELPPFHLGSLLQPFGSDYFSYEGTYDNGDVVLPTTWLISRNISVVNWRQLGEFEALYGRNGNRNCKNGREQQALGNRNVYLNM
ncbi:GM15779 [Drosophila sechellia]|uniref:GM15779 n=1 Tax=Drosophila sechellia TaxID=7238 RepID=B4I7F5_DROSE|nr:GM15779 [Drosophila sechellia]